MLITMNKRGHLSIILLSLHTRILHTNTSVTFALYHKLNDDDNKLSVLVS